MAGSYWKKVGTKLGKLGKRISKAAVPCVLNAAVDYAVETGIKKACEKINAAVNKLFNKSVVNSLITLSLNVFGMLIIIFKPLGNVPSNYIASFLFITALVFFWVRFVLFWINYGKITFETASYIFKEKSISKGIGKTIFQKFPMVSFAFTGIHIASYVIPSLNRVPEMDELVVTFIKLFWKKFAVFFAVMFIYTICVFCVLRPYLIACFTECTMWDVYFFPVTYTWHLIFK